MTEQTAVRVGINGFGRIGRCLLRAVLQPSRSDVQVVAINGSNLQLAAHLLKYDSTHGVLPHDIRAQDGNLVVDGRSIAFTNDRSFQSLDWGQHDVDVVLECTGALTSAEKLAVHFSAGAKRVLVSAPAKGADLTVVYGVNHHLLTPQTKIVSNASCTTNCLAPVAQVLHQTAEIETGLMSTVHAVTNDQKLLDATHSDARRARAAGVSIIPTKTGAAAAIGQVLPELDGKLHGVALRVPTQNVSLVDLTARVTQAVSAEAINGAMRSAAAENLRGVLAVNDAPLVSVDFNGRSESAIFDATQTAVLDGTLVKILAWYDNEVGFSHRMLDTAAHWASLPA